MPLQYFSGKRHAELEFARFVSGFATEVVIYLLLQLLELATVV